MANIIKKAGKKLLRLRDSNNTDDTGHSGDSSGRSGAGEPPKLPTYLVTQTDSASMLAEDTTRAEWERRAQEQAGEGNYGKVHTKDREKTDQAAPEGELQNDIAQHPLLNRQTYDGVPINDSNVPAQNTDARREYDNAQRLQHQKKLELQNNLTNTPQSQPSSAPTPRPGG